MLSRKKSPLEFGRGCQLLIQRFQCFFWFYLYLTLVEHRAVQSKDVDEEVIDGLALVLAEVVALVGQVDITHLVLGSIETRCVASRGIPAWAR